MVLKGKRIGLIALYVSTLFLFFVRMKYFLKDSANQSIELVLLWLVFFCSIFVIGLTLLYYRKLIAKYKDRWIVAGYILFLEILFVLLLDLSFSYIHIFGVLFILVLTQVPLMFLSKKIRTRIDYIVVVFFTLYVFLQECYYAVFNDFFRFLEFGTLKEGIESSENMYQFSIGHTILLGGLLVFILVYSRSKKSERVKWNMHFSKKYIVVVLVLFSIVNINAIYPVKSARMHLSDHYLYTSVFSKKRFVSRYGFTNLIWRDIFELITPDFSYQKDVEMVEEYLERYPFEHEQNEYTGIFEGKNLVIILGESFDELALSEELTPNIWMLKNEGMDFLNYYTPVFPRTTCDTEVAINASIIPSIDDGPTCYVYNDNSYKNSLAEVFNIHGYETSAFHNNYKEFYTRDVVYEGFGYDYLFGQNELQLSNSEKRYDSLFMSRSFDELGITEQPFMRFYLSLSGHSPYVSTHLAVEKHIELIDAHYPSDTPLEIKHYIAAQIELDKMVGELISELEESGELQNTVILFTNDHYPYTIKHSTYEEYTGIREEYKKNKSPLYIWTPDIKHTEIELLSSSIDVLPTIVNLFNLSDDYSMYIGHDIFDLNHDRIVYFKDYSILTEQGYYRLSEEDDYETLIQMASDMYDLSKRILRTDYFKKE